MQVEELKPGTKIRHFKGGEYMVVLVCIHTETFEKMVAYRKLGEKIDPSEQRPWIRPASMFGETVEHDGKEVPRFTIIS